MPLHISTMKKYTILSSDTEEETSDKDIHKMNKSCRLNNYPATPTVIPVITKQQTEVKLNNTHIGSRSSTQMVKNKETESFTWEQVRTPSIKSDEEISYWITTAKAPCLYHFDRDITSSLVSPSGSYVNELDNLYAPKGNSSSPIRSTHVLDGKSFDLPTYIPTSKCSNVQHNNSIPVRSKFVDSSHAKSVLNDNYISASENLLAGLHKEYREKRYNLKRPTVDVNDGVMYKMSKNTEPLDDYDTDSSVLTINYIKYVNNKQADNMKQSRLKRKYFAAAAVNSSDLKHSEILSRDSGCALQDKDSNIIELSSGSNTRPLWERVITRCNKSYNMDNILKPSYQTTKQINMELLDNSKTSSSSIENSFNNDSKFFKHSSKILSNSADNPDYSKLSKSDYSIDGRLSSCIVSSNLSKSVNNVPMIYTKVETVQYISTRDSYSSNLKSKQYQNSFQSQTNVAELRTEQVIKITQNCGYNNFL